MDADLEQTLRRISEKSRFLIERYKVLRERNERANERIAQLENELALRDKELETLRLQVQYNSLSSSLAPDRESLESTHAMIADLVREVDRCIADLNS